MNKAVELIRLWGVFEERYPDGTIEDFCRYRLAADGGPGSEKRLASEGRLMPDGKLMTDGKLVPDLNGRLVILLRRIGKFHIAYSNKALEGTGLDQMEEFGILVTIFNQGNPIKSEAIYNNIMELSSGTNMLIRMKKRGLVSEYADKGDKRVKRLKVTSKGEETLRKAKDIVLKVAHMMVNDLTDADKQLCIQLLGPVDRRFSGMFQKQKNKPFEEIYRENMSVKSLRAD
jgi:DNA-binding MarR family transcriptional regulator